MLISLAGRAAAADLYANPIKVQQQQLLWKVLAVIGLPLVLLSFLSRTDFS